MLTVTCFKFHEHMYGQYRCNCVDTRVCVRSSRDGAVSACRPVADGLLRGAQSVEGVVGEHL